MSNLLDFVLNTLRDPDQLSERIDDADERPRLVWELALADSLAESASDEEELQDLGDQIDGLEQRLAMG